MVLMQSIYGTYGCLMDEWVISNQEGSSLLFCLYSLRLLRNGRVVNVVLDVTSVIPGLLDITTKR
jgi:hypothetical protein